MTQIRIITDSTCDIPDDLLRKHHIRVVPCFVNYDGKSYADDGVQLKRDDYYRQLPHIRPVPKTSAFPPGLVEPALEAALSEADHVVILSVPAALSGVYNAFRLGASRFPADKVTLIDSGQITMGLGWQVILAAEVAEATGSIPDVLGAIERVRSHQAMYAALDTLEYLRYSGRVSWASAGIGTLLQIKPLLEVKQGEVRSHSRVRTFKRATEELAALARAQAPLDRLAIMHADNAAGASELYETLRDIAPEATITVNITPTIGTHIGPGGLGFASVSKSWRN